MVESIRLFNLCEGTNWSHLPLPGGWYAQSPRLIDDWEIIFKAKADQARRKDREAKNKAAAQKAKSSSRSGRRRGR